ncbi:MAG: DUF362 domain-containing protein [Patescibacteria group bacterium]
MSSKVFFTDLRTRSGRNILDKLRALFAAADLSACLAPGDLAALKIHAGEPGNLSVLRPPLLRTVVELVRACGAKPFLTDANTLYMGGRANAVDHALAAALNGYTPEAVGAPFIAADGLLGKDHELIKTGGELGEVKIAAALAQADALIALTHFKGHDEAGFGGVIKNLGMGGASRAGKLVQHAEVRPEVNPDKCLGCRRCARYCPAGAITYAASGTAAIDRGDCLGCGECIITCNHRAIAINWRAGETLQRRMAEHAAGLLSTKPGKCGFITFLMDISPDCDCCSWNDPPIAPSLGIAASRDPVALDQACADLVNAAPFLKESDGGAGAGRDKFRLIHPEADWAVQLDYARELGIGTREYELIEID